MKRHETDAVSLVCGLIFLIVGGLFLSGRIDAFDFLSVWALPFALLAVGLVMGAIALTRHRKGTLAGNDEPIEGL